MRKAAFSQGMYWAQKRACTSRIDELTKEIEHMNGLLYKHPNQNLTTSTFGNEKERQRKKQIRGNLSNTEIGKLRKTIALFEEERDALNSAILHLETEMMAHVTQTRD